ncbi:MAG TPA: DNA mismatch repair endonuclease MutL [Cyclobacteriaceae bacterium]|nr:DNA mismatch repair endonuclease MutL [Cyclobacteriaceae bacterium]
MGKNQKTVNEDQMTDIIRLLPDSLANQIAAGEVVQRPASVVKELIENSLDAGAGEIQVIIRDAGKSSIQIMDNGTGMSVTDARMCFERHATSKLKTSEDLYAIRTMGFRGEALASVAAVAQVELKTRRAEDELGTLIVIEGSIFKKQEPAACNPGTSILVKNLFYNVPARRNFLKSAPIEMKHIIDEFQYHALGMPESSMRLFHNDLEIYNLPAGKLGKRIVNLFGKNYQEQLVTCHEDTDHVKVWGYIGKPEYAKKTRGEQFLFVNKRYIRNNYLNHAVITAYEGLLPPDYFPFYTLFLELDPAHVDVNVHPTKTEVKFIDERAVYSVIRTVVKQALGTHSIIPSIDFSNDVNYSLDSKLGGASASRTMADLNYERLRSGEFQNLRNWETVFEGLTERVAGAGPEIAGGKAGSSPEISTDAENFPGIVSPATFQLHNRFILSQIRSGLMIIDQAAAYQRISYEKFMKNLMDRSGNAQRLIFPVTIELNPTDLSLVMEIMGEINNLGFEVETFGGKSVIINGIPSGMNNFSEKEIFENLIEQFKLNRDKLKLDIQENLARSLSRYASSRYIKKLREEEQGLLIDQLFACANPNYTPTGEPVYTIFTLNQIDDLLKKKS